MVLDVTFWFFQHASTKCVYYIWIFLQNQSYFNMEFSFLFLEKLDPQSCSTFQTSEINLNCKRESKHFHTHPPNFKVFSLANTVNPFTKKCLHERGNPHINAKQTNKKMCYYVVNYSAKVTKHILRGKQSLQTSLHLWQWRKKKKKANCTHSKCRE